MDCEYLRQFFTILGFVSFDVIVMYFLCYLLDEEKPGQATGCLIWFPRKMLRKSLYRSKMPLYYKMNDVQSGKGS